MGCGKSKHAVTEPITMKRAGGKKFDPKARKDMLEEIRSAMIEKNEKVSLKQESEEVDKKCEEDGLGDDGTKDDPNVRNDIVEEIKGAVKIEDAERLPLTQEREEVNKECKEDGQEDVLEVADSAEEKNVSMEEEKEEIEQENEIKEEEERKEIEQEENEENKEGSDIVVVEQPAELPSVDLSNNELSVTRKDDEGASESERSEYSSPHPSEIGKEHSFDEMVKLDEALQKTELFEATKLTENNEEEPTDIKEENLAEETKDAGVQVSIPEAEVNND